MSDIREARKELLNRVLDGNGKTASSDRRGAFNLSGLAGPAAVLAEKVAKNAATISDEYIAAARASGLSEDQVFEIVVCAAIGQADRQYEAAQGALAAAIGKE